MEEMKEVELPEKPELEEEDEDAVRLTPAQWAEIRAKYEAGTVVMRELSEEYGVALSTLSKHFRKYGVVKGSKIGAIEEKITEKVAEKAAEVIESFASKRLTRIEETKNEHYEAAKMIARLTNKTVIDAVKKGLPIAIAYPDLKALRLAAVTLESTRNQRYQILDIENTVDEKELPRIIFDNLSDKEIEELQRAEAESFPDIEVDDIEETS
jgi:hypothetical protein